MTLFARRTEVPKSAGYSLVDEQMVIRGEISTQGTIRIDGRLEGKTHRAGVAIIGAKGVVVGDLEAREVIIGGILEGNVVVEGRIEIQASASVRGDITAAAMLLHEGATVHGHVTVDHHATQTQPGLVEELARLEIASTRQVQALPG
ncbi:MAG TPA: polymer-forming cytoskeletal protein [Gemmatimonadaceae bacterium]|jgi:cytoskeletal protein CcmA (bactofilin family)